MEKKTQIVKGWRKVRVGTFNGSSFLPYEGYTVSVDGTEAGFVVKIHGSWAVLLPNSERTERWEYQTRKEAIERLVNPNA